MYATQSLRLRQSLRTLWLALACLLCASICLTPCSAVEKEEKLHVDDILAVVPSTYERFNLIRAGRQWRKGLKSYILIEKELTAKERGSTHLHRERWGVFEDDTHSSLVIGPRSGDLRAAVAPFMANKTVGTDRYKWILYGDDDTVFFIDNVMETLKQYDWRQPYLFTDCLWWPKNGSGVKLHPNREAPRCLPCNYQDPAIMPGNMCPGMTGFMPVQGCPCTPEMVMEGHWAGGQPKYADGKGIFDRRTAKFVERPNDPDSPNVGWWYMLHGGAGAIISRGAMERASFEEVMTYLKGIDRQSGDAMLTKAFWNVLRLAPTDPGYGLCRPGIQMFDPSWRAPRARGPEDAGTLDGGNDPLGIMAKCGPSALPTALKPALQQHQPGCEGCRLHALLTGATDWPRFEQSLKGEGCDEACEDQLLHTLTVHVRSRYAAQDLAESTGEAVKPQDEAPHYGAACHIMRKLPALHRRHAVKRRGRDKYIPLWTE